MTICSIHHSLSVALVETNIEDEKKGKENRDGIPEGPLAISRQLTGNVSRYDRNIMQLIT